MGGITGGTSAPTMSAIKQACGGDIECQKSVAVDATVANLTITSSLVPSSLLPKLGAKLFGKGAMLNRGKHFRVGIGRSGGESVFRIAGDSLGKIPKSVRDVIGIKETKGGGYKWDLWSRGDL